jgi:threonine dehydrogenase-like Zn-dependent dehydrogenase
MDVHQAVADVLVRYATGIDRRDWDLFRTCFTADVEADYGEIGVWHGVDEITEWMRVVHDACGHTMHRITNVVVSPDELGKPAMPFDLADDPFDAVLECSGHAAAMQAGLSQLKRGGTLVLVGAGMDWPRFDNNRITLNELVITGAFVYDPDGFPRALELLASPDFPTDVLIESDDVPLEGLYGAVERLVSGELPAKVMIVPSTGNGGER